MNFNIADESIFNTFYKEKTMANKNKNAAGAKNCKCDKCGFEAHSIPGKPHRRCSGQADQPMRKKSDYIPGPERGTWN